jgi:hypothetical protein
MSRYSYGLVGLGLFPSSVQINSGAHQASRPMDTRSFFTRAKVAAA